MQEVIRGLSEKLETSDKFLLAIATFALPAYLLYFSSGNLNWIIGVDQLYHLDSLYEPEMDVGGNPYGTKVYVYLPSFAIANALLMLPGYLAIIATLGEPAPTMGPLPNTLYLATGLVVTGLWSYISLVAIPYVSRRLYDDETIQFWGVVVLALAPPLWIGVFQSSANPLVALLVVLGLWSVKADRWLLAGIVIGLSTFKFNGVPFAIVLFLYALLGAGGRQAALVTIGGVISQIPNLAYFALYPADLVMIVERGGALSAHAHTFDNKPILYPVVALGAEDLYLSIFPLVVLSFSVLGAVIALRFAGGLPAGFAIGFFSTSWLVPGEQRFVPFVVLLLLLLVPLWHSDRIKLLIGAIFALTAYWRITVLAHESPMLGLPSEHVESIGLSNGTVVPFYAVYVLIPIATIYILYLLEQSDWSWADATKE